MLAPSAYIQADVTADVSEFLKTGRIRINEATRESSHVSLIYMDSIKGAQ